MKILHTADWHIGQLFYEYDRSYEHWCFLDWLHKTLLQEEIDVLLISGDVFDISNPAAASITLFYHFLNRAIRANPDLQIIITAGNHDSASRLEAPKPLLESSNIHIIGLVARNEDHSIDYEKHLIPLKNKQGEIASWCMAVPFLRMGDYPVVTTAENPYAEGVTAFYQAAYDTALLKKEPHHSVIAMGHLHAQQAEVTDMDAKERAIMGGVESISAAAFHSDLCYVALGHIHKAQRIGGKEHVRYSGSPIPMSFSEQHYKHQVIVFDLETAGISNLKPVEIPVAVELLRIPKENRPLDEVLLALSELPNKEDSTDTAPFLEVRVLLNGPEPALRHKIEEALHDKQVRLARIDTKYPTSEKNGPETPSRVGINLDELNPQDVFSKVYQSSYQELPPELLVELFREVIQQVNESEEQG